MYFRLPRSGGKIIHNKWSITNRRRMRKWQLLKRKMRNRERFKNRKPCNCLRRRKKQRTLSRKQRRGEKQKEMWKVNPNKPKKPATSFLLFRMLMVKLQMWPLDGRLLLVLHLHFPLHWSKSTRVTFLGSLVFSMWRINWLIYLCILPLLLSCLVGYVWFHASVFFLWVHGLHMLWFLPHAWDH